MELCHVQFRKSRLEKKQEQTAKAKDKAKTKIMAVIPFRRICKMYVTYLQI